MHPLPIRSRVNLLKEVLGAARKAASRLAPQRDQVARETEMWLHATIIEMTLACIRLFESGIYSPLPVLLRVAYEALAEQLALEHDPRYVDHMGAAAIHEGRALPELINSYSKEARAAFLGEPGARDFLRVLKQRAEEFAERGGSRREPEEKFTAAGIEDEYFMYRLLSGAVHNDGGVLVLRHLLRNSDGADRLAFFKVPSDMDLMNNLDQAGGTLLRSCRSLHRPTDEFQAYFDRWGALIAQAPAGLKRLSLLEKYKGAGKQQRD